MRARYHIQGATVSTPFYGLWRAVVNDYSTVYELDDTMLGFLMNKRAE